MTYEQTSCCEISNKCVTMISGLWTDKHFSAVGTCLHATQEELGPSPPHPQARVLLALYPQHSMSAFRSGCHVILKTSSDSPVKDRTLSWL